MRIIDGAESAYGSARSSRLRLRCVCSCEFFLLTKRAKNKSSPFVVYLRNEYTRSGVGPDSLPEPTPENWGYGAMRDYRAVFLSMKFASASASASSTLMPSTKASWKAFCRSSLKPETLYLMDWT